MLSKLLTVALCSSAVFANLAEADKRQAKATNEAQFNSAVSQLVSLYIPAPLSSLIVSAASATGKDAGSVVQSAFAAATAPSYLSQLPSQYRSNVGALASAVSDLRGIAKTGIAGAPIVTTDTSGATVTSIKGGGRSGGSNSASGGPLRSGAVVTTDASHHTITGLATTSTDSAGHVVTSLTTTFPILPVPLGSGSSGAGSSASAASSKAKSGASSVSAAAGSAASSSSAEARSLASSLSAGATSASSSSAEARSLASSLSAGATSALASAKASASSLLHSASAGASTATAAAAPSSSNAAANPIAVGPGAGGILAFIGMLLAV